jgi:hypothetical protein
VTAPRRSVLGRFVRLYFWALLAALVLGFGIGLWIRHRLEAPRLDMGALPRAISGVAAPTPAP